MDAATLYIVMALPNGELKTSTQGFSSLGACQAQADFLKFMARGDPQSPRTAYRCEIAKPTFYLIVCDWRGRSCEHTGPLSRQGCATQQWVARLQHHMRKYTHCFPREREQDRGWSE